MTTKYLDENGLRHLLSEIRSDVTPIKDGTAAVGTSKKLAKADHVHPKVSPSDIGAASSSHTHGNVTNAGALQTTDIDIASGDKLVIADSSDSGKIARSSVAFDGSTLSQVLSKAGSFVDLDNCNIAFGYCSSHSGTNNVDHPVTFAGSPRVIVQTGTVLVVYFSVYVPATNDAYLRLTDSSGTEKRFNIYYRGGRMLPDNFPAGSILTFMIGPGTDGTGGPYAHFLAADNWATLAPFGSGGATCLTAADTAEKTADISFFTPSNGGIVRITFNNAVSANATLNISSTGAKNIRYNGANITAGLIRAGDTVTLMRIGNYYNVIGIDRLISPEVFTGATTSADGTTGLVPAPFHRTQENDIKKEILCADSKWRYVWLQEQRSQTDDYVTLKLNFTDGLGASAETIYDSTRFLAATQSYPGVMTAADKTKLDSIAEGAEVNVQANWTQTTSTADDYIKNKPTIPSANSTATNIKMDGTQSAGSLTTFAKADHVHPTDTSRAPLASPALTGTPTAPTASAGTNTTQIATTAFVSSAISTAITGAVAYQGTVPITGQTGGFAPTNTTAGWYWIVQSAGTYAGVVCEAGDMIFCKTASSTYSASNFDVIQTNLDIATMTNAEIESAISA